MEMRDGNDQDLIGTDLIDDSVRKSIQAISPGARSDGMPSIREIYNLAQTAIEFFQEFLAEPYSYSVVPVACIFGLCECSGRNTDLHALRGYLARK